MARLLTLNDVADILSVSRRTLQYMIARGEFPLGVKVTDSLVRWKEADVDAWIDERKSRHETHA